MKVELFVGFDHNTLEKEINQWLKDNPCKIKFIKQSINVQDNIVISIWFTTEKIRSLPDLD